MEERKKQRSKRQPGGPFAVTIDIQLDAVHDLICGRIQYGCRCMLKFKA
jgi:hypothetical protein